MFRTLRLVKEKAIDKPTGADADDKKRIKDIEEAAIALERSVGFYCKSFAESNANAAAFALDLANLYPANEGLSVAVMTLNSSGAVFRDAGKMADDIHATMLAPIAAIKDRLKALYAKADERQVLRAEITHYREKVTRLANEGLSNTKAQAKAESNQEKLFKNQQRFRDLDAELATELDTLDHEVAELSNAGIARVIQIHATFASGLLHCYGNALAAIPGAMKAGGPIAGVVVPTSASSAAVGGGGASPATAAKRPAAGGAGASPAASSFSAPSGTSSTSASASAGLPAMSLSAFTAGSGSASATSSSPAASSFAAFAGSSGSAGTAAPSAGATTRSARGSFTGGAGGSAAADPMAAALAAASAVGGGAYGSHHGAPSTASADSLPSAFGASVSLHGGFSGSGSSASHGPGGVAIGTPANPFGEEPANPFASPTAASTGTGFHEGSEVPRPAPAE